MVKCDLWGSQNTNNQRTILLERYGSFEYPGPEQQKCIIYTFYNLYNLYIYIKVHEAENKIFHTSESG